MSLYLNCLRHLGLLYFKTWKVQITVVSKCGDLILKIHGTNIWQSHDGYLSVVPVSICLKNYSAVAFIIVYLGLEISITLGNPFETTIEIKDQRFC